MEYYKICGQWQPPIFEIAGTMTPRALTWRTLLYDLVFACWEIGLPDGWLYTPFRYMLFGGGSLGVTYTDELGWIYGTYGVEKIGWQYEPLLFNVNNHVLSNPAKGIRGVNGTILHVHDDYTGLDPIITAYAELLASCDKGVEINLRQARMGKLIPAESQKDAKSIEDALKGKDDGEPIAFVNKKLFDDNGRLNVSSILGDGGRDFIGDRLMETRLMIIKEFLTRIGVRTVGMEKREHLLDQEINENNDETGAEPYVIMSSLKDDLAMLARLGCTITIKPRFSYAGAGVEKEGTRNDEKITE